MPASHGRHAVAYGPDFLAGPVTASIRQEVTIIASQDMAFILPASATQHGILAYSRQEPIRTFLAYQDNVRARRAVRANEVEEFVTSALMPCHVKSITATRCHHAHANSSPARHRRQASHHWSASPYCSRHARAAGNTSQCIILLVADSPPARNAVTPRSPRLFMPAARYNACRYRSRHSPEAFDQFDARNKREGQFLVLHGHSLNRHHELNMARPCTAARHQTPISFGMRFGLRWATRRRFNTTNKMPSVKTAPAITVIQQYFAMNEVGSSRFRPLHLPL